MKLILDSKVEDDKLVLYPKGELDVYNSSKFKEEALEIYNKNKLDIIIDGKELEYLDSTGLGSLIYLLKILKNDEKKIIIKNLSSSIEKLFVITKLDEMFEIRR